MKSKPMPFANEVIREVRLSNNIKLESLSRCMGYSTSQINAVENGDRRATIKFVRSMFHATGDLRLVELIAPGVAAQLAESATLKRKNRPTRTPPPGDPKQLLPELLSVLEACTAATRYVEQIVRDGRVDESDDTAIAGFMERSNSAVKLLAKANRAMIAWRDETERATG